MQQSSEKVIDIRNLVAYNVNRVANNHKEEIKNGYRRIQTGKKEKFLFKRKRRHAASH
jgi:hypothetical protein